MIREPCWTEEDGRGFSTGGHDDAEVPACHIKKLFLFAGHGHKGAGQPFDSLSTMYKATSSDRSFMRSYRIAVGGGDFKWTIG